MSSRLGPAFVVLSVLAAACGHDWNDYDPRLGGEATSSGTGDGGRGEGGSETSVSSAGGSTSTGTSSKTLEIVALEADCIDPYSYFPDPQGCDFAAARDAFTIDRDADYPHDSWVGFMRFSPGAELAGKTIDAVALRLRVSGEPHSDADDSGVVWEVEPFDRDSLNQGPPNPVGDDPIGASVGAVALSAEVVFELVGLTVQPSTPIYLSMVPTTEDGVDYTDERSATPPTLIVTYH